MNGLFIQGLRPRGHSAPGASRCEAPPRREQLLNDSGNDPMLKGMRHG